MRPSLSIQPLPCRNFCTVFDSKYWRRLPSRRASYEGSGAGAVPSENPRSRSSVVSLPRLITLTLAMALCWADHYPRRENDVRHSHLPAEVCALCCCLSICFCSDFLDSTQQQALLFLHLSFLSHRRSTIPRSPRVAFSTH